MTTQTIDSAKAERLESAFKIIPLADGGERVVLKEGLESEFLELMRAINGTYTGDPSNWPKDFPYAVLWHFDTESAAEGFPDVMAQSFADSAYCTGKLHEWVYEDRYSTYYLDQALREYSADTFDALLTIAARIAAEEIYAEVLEALTA